MAALFVAAFVARSSQTAKGYARRSRLGSAKNSWPRRCRDLFVTVLDADSGEGPIAARELLCFNALAELIDSNRRKRAYIGSESPPVCPLKFGR